MRQKIGPVPRQLDTSFSLPGDEDQKSIALDGALAERIGAKFEYKCTQQESEAQAHAESRCTRFSARTWRGKPGFKSDQALFFGRFLVDSRSYTLKQAVTAETACIINQQLATPCNQVKHSKPGSSPVSRSIKSITWKDFSSPVPPCAPFVLRLHHLQRFL